MKWRWTRCSLGMGLATWKLEGIGIKPIIPIATKLLFCAAVVWSTVQAMNCAVNCDIETVILCVNWCCADYARRSNYELSDAPREFSWEGMEDVIRKFDVNWNEN